jgi:type II secretory pathway component PulF
LGGKQTEEEQAMKYDELAFMNQQLAGMLHTGIPLEGALKQLCANMRGGLLRSELERLEADLAQGVPLAEAVTARRLPPFYVAMVRVGVQSNDLPAILTLLADYYHQVNNAWVRLKGLMVYPLIVLLGALGLSLALSFLFHRLAGEMTDLNLMVPASRGAWVTVWIAPSVLAFLVVLMVAGLSVPRFRSWLRWHFPGFRETSLAQTASSLSLLLARGSNLDSALDLMRRLEGESVAGRELAQWQERLRQGEGKLEDFAASSTLFPQLFLWLAANAGQDLGAGFRRAAEIYQGRATHQIEMLLYACLPVSILLLGLMILGQVYPVVRIFIALGGLADHGLLE